MAELACSACVGRLWSAKNRMKFRPFSTNLELEELQKVFAVVSGTFFSLVKSCVCRTVS